MAAVQAEALQLVGPRHKRLQLELLLKPDFSQDCAMRLHCDLLHPGELVPGAVPLLQEHDRWREKAPA